MELERPPAWRLRLVLAAFSGVLLSVILWLGGTDLGSNSVSGMHNIFFHLAARNEPAVLTGVILFLVVGHALSLPRWGARFRGEDWDLIYRMGTFGAVSLAFCLSLFGTFYCYHNFGLSLDEYLTEAQAQCFARGKLAGQLPEELFPFAPALLTGFLYVDGTDATFSPQYLPGYALLMTPFVWLNAKWLIGPLLAAGTVLCTASAAKMLFPDKKWAPCLAAVLLATSPQFLVCSMTPYPWNGHLFLNSLWLCVFLSQSETVRLFLPWVGGAAIGMHRPHVHALFALPFLIWIAFRWPKKLVAYVVLVYLAWSYGWFSWMTTFIPGSLTRHVSELGHSQIEPYLSRFIQLGYHLTWSNIAVPLLACICIWRIFKARVPVRLCAISFVLTFCFYILFPGTGGHGWGARYSHSVIHLYVILGVSGAIAFHELHGKRDLMNLLAGSFLFTVVFLLPLRWWQVESFVRPYAKTAEVLANYPADIVVADFSSLYYGFDLRRNDFLFVDRPLVLSYQHLTQKAAETLSELPKEQVKFVGRSELAQHGIPVVRRTGVSPFAPPQPAVEAEGSQ
jgi:hypothetical protein